MAKQPCFYDHSTTVSNRDYDRLNIEALLDLIDTSFDHLVDSRSTDSHHDDFTDRALHLGSVILEAGKRSARKQSTVHNTSIWPLTIDLTVKVFSMLDTRSTCIAAATCLFFQQCAKDPSCYTNIDLACVPHKIILSKFNSDVASSVIERSGNALQSIKLSDELYNERYESHIVSCLSSLNANGGALGSHLRRLHLDHIHKISENELSATLSESLSVCPSLVELKFVGMIIPMCDILESVSRYCHLLERFIVEFGGGANYTLESSVLKEFVLKCPKITALAMQSCGLLDPDAYELLKGFHNLKYADFAGCHKLTGAFLTNLVTKGGGSSLEVMILRDLWELEEVATKKFMNALIAGEFRYLRYLDISQSGGFIYKYKEDDYRRYYADDSSWESCEYGVRFFKIPVKELLHHRPNFCMVVEYNESNYDTSSFYRGEV